MRQLGRAACPKTKGLGSIGGHPNPNSPVQGLYMHTALAMTSSGMPLENEGEKDNSKATKFREAELEIKSLPITLTPSRKQTQVVKEKINLHAVEAKELNPPEGLEVAHWFLLTTLEVNTFEESLYCYYKEKSKIPKKTALN